RPFRKILLPQRRNLIDLALRCEQDDDRLQRACVRDLVRECMVCRKKICRNCTFRRKPAGMSGRKRQLCTGCKSDPDVISSEPCMLPSPSSLWHTGFIDSIRRLSNKLLDVLRLWHFVRP